MADLQGQTSTGLTDVLKNLYVEPLVGQLFDEILVNQLLEVDSEHFEGLKAVLGLHTDRSDGIGARLEGEDLPLAGKQQYGKLEYDMASHYGRVGVSGQAIARSKTPAGAFVRAFDFELSRIRDDLALDFARQIYGPGTGVIATIDTGASSATQTLEDAEALRKGFLYVGMRVDIGTAADPVNSVDGYGDVVHIIDVDPDAGTITFSSSVSTTTGHFVSRAGNNYTNATKEMDAGIQRLVSTSPTEVGGLDPTDPGKEFWDNLRDTSATVTLTGTNGFLINWNRVSERGARPADIRTITTPGIVRQLFESDDFLDKVRFVDNTELNGGFERITFQAGAGKIALYPDRLAPWGKVYMLHRSHIRMFSPGDWDFLARDGQPIKWQQDKDGWQAILYKYANMGTDRRNTSLVMSGIEDSGV